MKIRLEETADYFEVENLTREAFWNVYMPGCSEHFVLHNLREDKNFIKELDYVLEEDGKIIANIVYATGILKLKDETVIKILTFGPVSVLPEYQKRGYGEKIINHTLDLSKMLGYNEVVILGNPEYYKKYGFESASKYNIYYKGMDLNEETPFFMIKIFDKNKFNIDFAIYSDPEGYEVDQNKLEEYDKKFSPKIKEKREGQLFS